MSAYIVSRQHIAFLVEAGLSLHPTQHHRMISWVWNVNHETGTHDRAELRIGDYQRASEVGQMLWDENRRSVRYRYPNDTDDTLPGPIDETFEYEHKPMIPRSPINPVDVLKACSGFEYQACEHPEWEQSEAKAYIQALRDNAITSLPGYEDSPYWSL